MRKTKQIHAWDIPQLRVVEIENKLVTKLRRIIKYKQLIPLLAKRTYYKEDTLRKFLAKIKNGKVIKRDSIPFDIVFKLCKILKIDKYELEKSLKSVKTLQMKCKIINCKFPIEIDPIFVSFLFHHYGDGCGRVWTQDLSKNITRKRYFEKAEHIVGKISNWKSKGKKEVRTPAIFMKLFNLVFHLTYKDLVNNIITNKIPSNDTFNTAILVSMIMDDSCITKNSIVLCQKSRELLSFVRARTMKLLGRDKISKIQVRHIKYKGLVRKYYVFSILSSGILPFYKHLKRLINHYGQLMDLGNEMSKFMSLVNKYQEKLRKANLVQEPPPKSITPSLIKILHLISQGFDESKEIIKISELKKSMIKELLKRTRIYGLTNVALGRNGGYKYHLTNLGYKFINSMKN